MKKLNFKFVVFALILSAVAIVSFANTRAEAAGCIVHTFSAATCTSPRTCTKCGATSGSALGHNFVTSGQYATCTRCGATRYVGGTTGPTVTVQPTKTPTRTTDAPVKTPTPTSPVHVHTWTAATCEKPKTCTGCGATEGAALGHNFEKFSETQPNCVNAGEIVYKCTRCGKTKTDKLDALGHNYKTETIVEPTCTTAGKKVSKCTRCGAVKSETVLEALGHDYKTTTTTATCTTAGKTTKKCSRCGDTQTTTTPALGHDYKTTTTTATCTAAGKTTKKCSRCGDTQTTTTPALGHDYKTTTTSATCTEAGKTTKKCSRCGDTITTTTPALGHDYKTTTTSATCTEAGKTTKKCSRCGDTITTTTPALGHKECIVFNTKYHWTECERCNKIISPEEEHIFNDDDVCKVCGYKRNGSVDPEDPDSDLIVEPWMRENEDLNKLAVSLRSEPYDYEENERANKNIYVLDEKIIYYVDYKNGAKTTEGKVELVLNLPLTATVVERDGGEVSKKNGTITWTFDGMKKGEAGTKVVVVKYTSLGSAKATFKRIKPTATISLDGKKKDISAVINLIIKDFDEEINDEHDPYMYGDKDVETFRPDDTITRAEGALVLTRIFGISTAYNTSEYDFPDLNETYVEARRAIRAARAYGLINGYPDGTFKPNATMTIGEFMTIIARQIEEDEGEGFEIKDETEAIKIYKDKTRLYFISDREMYDAHWAAQYATLLCRLNMTAVKEKETNLRLGNAITRAEVAQLVNFYLLRAPAKITRTTFIRFPDVSRNHKLIGDIIEATRETHTYSINEDGLEIAE